MNERKRFLRRAAKTALDLIYPPRCPFCEKIVPVGNLVHEACLEALPRIPGERCSICGKPVPEGDTLCEDCGKTKHAFRQGAGAFLYERTMREAVLAFKFRGKKEYGTALGILLAEEGKPYLEAWKSELLLPVPMNRKKERQRGFNQAAVLARKVSEIFGIPTREDLLVRNRDTEAMKQLDAVQRRENLFEAFSLTDPSAVRGKNICVIDDIYTTGATADAVSRVLLAAGAREVCVLTLCIGSGYLRDIM